MLKSLVLPIVFTILPIQLSAQDRQDPQPKEFPAPFQSKSVINHPKVIGWPNNKSPTAPAGFKVTRFAELENPRWLYVLPTGEVLVAQSRTLPKPAAQKKSEDEKTAKEKKSEKGMEKSKTVTGDSPNRISILKDKDGDGIAESQETWFEGLKQPFGMLVLDKSLYIAATDGVWMFPYEAGSKPRLSDGKKIIELPAGGYNNHWTRNITSDGKKLYISVGSASNVAEHGMDEEKHRANILIANLDGSELRVFADGLRNPVGMAWQPTSKELWTVVNERDELGDDLVPDYFTSVGEGKFYGWPYSYFGQHEDPRLKGQRPDLVKKAVVPDFALDPHSASLGLTFYEGKSFPKHYSQGAFIGQRGSWNRSKFAGYRVVFVPFSSGKPSGKAEDFLSGFIKQEGEVYGRPVGVAVAADGSLLVADEPGNIVWLVQANKP
jgi:glucose/arabinose dehydrogenase